MNAIRHLLLSSAWPWPLPALATWMASWAVWLALDATGVGAALALAAACGLGLVLAWHIEGTWRRGIAAAGFPLSALLLQPGATPLGPAWGWLLAALPLAALYPLRAWRDAPFFPTPLAALQGIEGIVQPAPRHVLDAGCGLGHGLHSLRRAWPRAALFGVEYSQPMAWLSAWRCERAEIGADIWRADMWDMSWEAHDLVYLFQRPESMARAWDKARAEMAPGSWLVSLEFAIPGVEPSARLEGPQRRPVWIYRVPEANDASPTAS